MKLHQVLCKVSLEIVQQVIEKGAVLDSLLASTFHQNPRWGKRDRHFIAQTVFESVRWKRALADAVGCDAYIAILAAQWMISGYEIPAWWNYDGNGKEETLERWSKRQALPRALRESIPDWLDEYGVKALGEALWEREMSALNQRARVFLRVNLLKNSREELQAWLLEQGVTAYVVDQVDTALVLEEGALMPKSLRQNGRFEIQDAGSQQIVPFLHVKEDWCVMDACCGAGGKTLHLADLMKHKGNIIAMDIHAHKLKVLQERAQKAGANKIQTAVIQDHVLKHYEGKVDALILDVPCSGLGTLKRQPDLKWRISPQSIKRILATQQSILESYTKMLKPDGTLLYATCSILPAENHQMVEHLIQTGKWQLEAEQTLSATQFDGFYMARLRKVK